jgi:hypothetical protein
MFGTLKAVVLPSDVDIERKVSEAFAALGIQFVEIPFALKSARSSFLKTIHKSAPSDGSQQFKDGVLWADCLTLLEDDDVVLVTDDKAFYEGHAHSNGLSATLRDEVQAFAHTLKLVPGLPELLKEIRCPITLDEDALTETFLAGAGSHSAKIPERNGFKIGKRTKLTYDLFITGVPNVVFLEFEIEFQCNDISEGDRRDGLLIMKGDGLYNTTDKSFAQLGELGTEFRFRDDNDVEQSRKNVVLRVGPIVLGHESVTHIVRQKIE